MANTDAAGSGGSKRTDGERGGAGNADPSVKTTEAKVELTWRHNRTHELRLGHTVIEFSPNQTKTVPLWVLEHGEFKNQSIDFVVGKRIDS